MLTYMNEKLLNRKDVNDEENMDKMFSIYFI
jgi:hypothetical protein